MALVWKAIKPQRLKDKGFRITLINKARKVGNAMKRDFEETTKTWNHKPIFTVDVSTKGQGPAVLVGTDNEIYRFVNDGTKPHDIFPKRGKVLRFQSGYSAKTSAGVIGSGGGGASGPTLFRPYVRHPGTKARKFDEAIAKKWQPRFKQEMQEAMAEATRESGHSI